MFLKLFNWQNILNLVHCTCLRIEHFSTKLFKPFTISKQYECVWITSTDQLNINTFFCQLLRARDLKHGNQAMVLLNWLFQDDILFQYTVGNLAGIIMRRDDRYVALGWCILGRSLIEYENAVKNIATDGNISIYFKSTYVKM